ncbi:hypothetical protein HOO65_010743 [Ceratocystis lukuohia]|uniref:Uncharacterized protein n=1 Tax=Ceratocystis lukuohia TaxID=2019550 RepID=A0ABR4MSY1_9PEZI
MNPAANPSIHVRDGTALGHSTEPLGGTVMNVLLALVSTTVITGFLVQRSMNIKHWKRLPYVVWLVFAIYIDSYCFVFATAVLQLAFGVNTAYSKKRRITYIEDGVCVIGMRDVAMIPLISFDAVVNVYLTVMFLFPLKRLYSYSCSQRTPAQLRLRSVATRTFIGAVCTLVSSITNLTVLMALSGEPGWICLICCNSDILFSALVIQWVTSKDNAGTSDSANRPNCSADHTNGDSEDHALSYIDKSDNLRSRSTRQSTCHGSDGPGFTGASGSGSRGLTGSHSGPYSGHSCPNSHTATARAATIDDVSLSSDDSDIKYPSPRLHRHPLHAQTPGAVVVTTTIQRESKPTEAFLDGADNERLLAGAVQNARNGRFERPGSLTAVGSGGAGGSSAVIATATATTEQSDRPAEGDSGLQKSYLRHSGRTKTGTGQGRDNIGVGADTKSMLTAVRACALRKALFAASAWSGLETTKEAAEKLNISLRKCLQAALPMYRTTPRECLHHAAGIPPFEILLEDEKRREAIRWHTLDDRHILRGPNFNPVVARLRKHLPAQMEKHTRLRPLLEGPDMPPQTWLSKEEETKRHQAEMQVATRAAIIEDGATQEVNHIALGKWMEMADAEAVGALEATKRATACEGAREIWLCLDNRGVVDRLRNAVTKNSTSQEAVDETRRILKAWADKTPGRLAREHGDGEETSYVSTTKGGGKNKKDTVRLEPASPLNPIRNTRYKGLTRIELGHILAARTGDRDFDRYHARWGHNCPLGCRACNQAKERGHWWTCKALPRPWSQRFADTLLKNTKATCYVANVLRRNLRLFQETQQPEPELS